MTSRIASPAAPRMLLALVMLAVTLAIWPTPVHAGYIPVIDIEQEQGTHLSGYHPNPDVMFFVGQSFRPTRSGPLMRIDAMTDYHFSYRIQLYEAAADGLPTGVKLAAAHAMPLGTPWASYTFSNPVSVTAGKQYVWVVGVYGGISVRTTDNVYADGVYMQGLGTPDPSGGLNLDGEDVYPAPLSARSGTDAAFRTYIGTEENTPPHISISIEAPDQVANTSWYNIASSGTDGVKVNVTASDSNNVASFTCAENGEELNGIGGALPFPTTLERHYGRYRPSVASMSDAFVFTDGLHTITCSAGDTASPANVATVSKTFAVDQTPPTANWDSHACLNPGKDGWCRDRVFVGFIVADATSGLHDSYTERFGPELEERTQGSAVMTVTGEICDLAGNCMPGAIAGPFKIDSVAPTLNPTVEDQHVVIGSQPVINPNASDATSGIANQSCYPLDTRTPGENWATCWAEDNAGNTTWKTIIVKVHDFPHITDVTPSAITARDTDGGVTISGTGFASGAKLRWTNPDSDGTGPDTEIVVDLNPIASSATSLTVALPAELLANAGTVELRVVAPGGHVSSMQPLFITEASASIASSQTAEAVDGTATVTSESDSGGISATATGSGTLSVATYTADRIPVVTSLVGADGLYVDLYVASGSSFSSISTTICYPTGSAPDSAQLAWYDPAAGLWQPVSGQTYDASTGCFTVTLDASSSPSVGQLTGTVFATLLDATPPTITPHIDGVIGDNGWHTSDVTVTWSVTDAESTVSSSNGCEDQVITTDTAGVTFTCTAASAGGSDSMSVTIKRDATKPMLAPSVSPNPVLLRGAASATHGASDAMSGLASHSCSIVDTASVGAKTATCTATDAAGNAASASATYQVTYGFSGFSAPVDPVVNIAKAGQSIPLKWRVTDAAGNPVTTLTSVSASVASLSCSAGTTTDAIEEYATSTSGLQNLGNGYYQFNWKSDKSYANSCKTLKLDLGDGTSRTAEFKFTR